MDTIKKMKLPKSRNGMRDIHLWLPNRMLRTLKEDGVKYDRKVSPHIRQILKSYLNSRNL